jgi:ABC-type cobalamin/Fe3+-siderophores transport system ATPase subunit
MSWLHLTEVSVALRAREVVRGISASLERAAQGVIVRPAGTGKTTQRQAIAPCSGTIRA